MFVVATGLSPCLMHVLDMLKRHICDTLRSCVSVGSGLLCACRAATAIVASQAMISASFQIVKQAIAQNFFPRFNIRHTNKKHEGQIYIAVRRLQKLVSEHERGCSACCLQVCGIVHCLLYTA